MLKFINSIKKLLAIISTSIFAAFMIVLIVISSLPHGKTYNYEYSFLGIKTMDICYTFEGDEVTMDASFLGSHSIKKTKFKIDDGNLYFLNQETNEWDFGGEIDSYKIIMKTNAEETGIGDKEVVLKCKTNRTVRLVSVICMGVFGLIAFGCIYLCMLEKKGALKFLKEDGMFAQPGGEYVSFIRKRPTDIEENNLETMTNIENSEEIVEENIAEESGIEKYIVDEDIEKNE